MLKPFFYIFATGILLMGCKTTKIQPVENQVNNSINSKEIAQKHLSTLPQFETLSGSVSVALDNGKTQQNLPFTLRMKKNETLWLSAPLGIAKALLTPQKAQFYNKLDSTSFDGDYSIVQTLIGVQLDFQMIENLLLGQCIVPFENQKITHTDQGYQWYGQKDGYTINALLNTHFRVGQTQISSPEKNIKVIANYTYQSIGGQLFPSELHIESSFEGKQTTLKLSFDNLEINQSINFPFKMPSGYKSVIN